MTAADAQLWIQVASAAVPVAGQIAQGIAAVIQLVRRSRNEPPDDRADNDTAFLIAQDVAAALEAAKKPWNTIGDVARGELDKLNRREQ